MKHGIYKRGIVKAASRLKHHRFAKVWTKSLGKHAKIILVAEARSRNDGMHGLKSWQARIIHYAIDHAVELVRNRRAHKVQNGLDDGWIDVCELASGM